MIHSMLDTPMLLGALRGGAALLRAHEEEINDLNVFPIPDGDTGSNMLLTICGGAEAQPEGDMPLGKAARKAADGMLLSARGNSGVILSQLADGFAAGLEGLEQASAKDITAALQSSVKTAYAAVLEPAEGTILTVAREAAEAVSHSEYEDLGELLSAYIAQAEKTLAQTPELLPVLKQAGVVDSGGAGLIYIVKGMSAALSGDELPSEPLSYSHRPAGKELDLDLFDENSELEFGYCTELLLRLQNAKCDVKAFDVETIRAFLQTIGDSVVCFKNGSIVKLHVHTREPYRALEYCQQFGEYLTVKIENMSLQHNNQYASHEENIEANRKAFGVVAVATGDGVISSFREMGADVVIDAGSHLNPSAEDFRRAYIEANADTVFVLPNNKNAVLAAKQGAEMTDDIDVRIISSDNIGEGYAALSMLDLDSGNADTIEQELNEATNGVVTALVSQCSRSTEMDDFVLKEGQYIGISDKEIVSADNDRRDAAFMLSDKLDFDGREICILILGEDSDEEEAGEIASYIRSRHPGCEVFTVSGGQPVYSYIMVIE